MNLLQPIIDRVRQKGIRACELKARNIVSESIGNMINIGGGRSSETRYPLALNIDGERDIIFRDFNVHTIPVRDDSFDTAICEQVIEHLHNTTFFLSECQRILKKGGTFLLSTENLGSLPNIFALLLGKAPFSCQPLCGKTVGGFKRQVVNPDCTFPTYHSAFSGCRGHVRVMTKGQLKELLVEAGFFINKIYSFSLNHYILFHCTKLP